MRRKVLVGMVNVFIFTMLTYSVLAIPDKSPKLIDLKVYNNQDSIENYVRSEKVNLELTSDVELQSAEIIKEGKVYRALYSFGILTEWYGELDLSEDPEGFKYLQIKLRDLENNVNVINPADYKHLDLDDFVVKIDNTLILNPTTDYKWSSDWKTGGIDSEGGVQYDRFTGKFITKDNGLKINGKAEKNQRLEIFVNGVREEIIFVSDKNCSANNEEIITSDELIVRNAEFCDYSYDYKFPDDGKDNSDGSPKYMYEIKVRALDKAGNRSEFVEYPVIYHDSDAVEL